MTGQNKKLFLAFFPISFLIALAVAVAFRFLDHLSNDWIVISNAIINFLLFRLGTKLGIICHEAGHLYAAKLVGGLPKRMMLGSGHRISKFELLGIKVVVNSRIRSGVAFAAFEDLRHIKGKLFAFTLGGPLVNVAMGLVLYLIFGFDFYFIKGLDGIDPIAAFIASNVLLVPLALIPFYVRREGMKIPSDGLAILKIPFHSHQYLQQLSSSNDMLEAMDLFEDKKFKEAADVYLKSLDQNPDLAAIKISLAMSYLKLGAYDKALEYLRSLKEVMGEEVNKPYQMHLYNALAWIYLVKSELEPADKYSTLALELGPDQPSVKGTRASVLIEQGKIKEGEALIEEVDFKYPNSETLMASIYLMYTFSTRNQPRISANYRKFVEKNIDLLDADEKLLFERMKHATENFKSESP